MAKDLTAVQKEEFDSEVKKAYQGNQTLRMSVKVRHTSDSGIYKFRTRGKGIASLTTRDSADVIPMDTTDALVNCILNPYSAPEYTSMYGKSIVNFDDIKETAESISMALGRRDDQLIIDALALTTTTPVGTGLTALTVAEIRTAKKRLDSVEAPFSDRFFVLDEKGMSDLLATTEVTSSDFNSVKALVHGDFDTFLGFKFLQIGSARAEGGLPLAATVRTAFAYHKDSIGEAVNIDIETEVNYVAHKESWLSLGRIQAGSVIIDNEGIVPVEYLAS